MLDYTSIGALVESANNSQKKISQLVLEDQALEMEECIDTVYKRMEESFDVMMESVREGENPNLKSTSGLTGGEGYKMKIYGEKTGGGLCGEFMVKAMSRALSVSGCNAAMGRIVATPTAGSCGILPGCLVSLYEDKKIPKKDIVMAIFTSAAFGMVIAKNASIAGAQGGCQAECGSAAAMAAAALVEVLGGTPQESADACAMAIVNQMGLVCDPVAGLVEIPCIKRNVASLVVAMSSAEMALAGIVAHIPADECIVAMKQVGDAMSSSLKETSLGGIATSKTGLALKEKVFGNAK